MTDAFKQGDLVQLRSGGPAMTVSTCPSDPASGKLYQCVWFKGATRDHAGFSEHLLKAFVAPKK